MSQHDFKVILDNEARVGIVASDAGGANVLMAFSRLIKGSKSMFLNGASLKLIESNNNNSWEHFSDFLSSSPTGILLGTSGRDKKRELQAIKFARSKFIPTYAFLDHWTDYLTRFQLSGDLILPDCLVAGDRKSYEIAYHQFPMLRVVYFPNVYLLEQRQIIESHMNSGNRKESHTINVLILTEPTGSLIEKSMGCIPYSSQDALRAALKFLELNEVVSRIKVRIHPSEEIYDYDEFVKENPHIDFSVGKKPISHDIANSDWVIGTHSMGLFLASISGKKAISVIPKNGLPCTIPYDSVKKVFVDSARGNND